MSRKSAKPVLGHARARERLQPRHRRQRLRLAGALLLEQVGQQEREVDRLLGIEPRIADRVIAVVEILVGDLRARRRCIR